MAGFSPFYAAAFAVVRKRGKDEDVMRSKNEGVMRMAVRFISVWSVCHIGMHAPLALPPSPAPAITPAVKACQQTPLLAE